MNGYISQHTRLKEMHVLRETFRKPRKKTPWVNDAHWPVVVVTPSREDDLQLVIDSLSALYARGKFFLVFDVRAYGPLSTIERHRVAAARASDEERWPGICRAIATVATPEQRGTVRALGWLAPTRCPQICMGGPEGALGWCEEMVKDEKRRQ